MVLAVDVMRQMVVVLTVVVGVLLVVAVKAVTLVVDAIVGLNVG